MDHDLFFELHHDLPREGPGDDASTAHALRIVSGHLPARRRILDIGCGPGAQTLVLARETDGTITAVDVHRPFLHEVERRAHAAGVSDRVRTMEARMDALPLAPASFDVIWSEGAVWVMGFAAGLSAWWPLLRLGGVLVVSELTWLVDDPAPQERAFWARGYPAMQGREANREAIGAAGYELLAEFVLAHASWFAQYLGPLEHRAETLAAHYAHDETVLRWIAEQREEIDVARRFSGFGYVFYCMRRCDRPDASRIAAAEEEMPAR